MQTTTSGYMLLIRGTHWRNGLSEEEIRNVMERWTAWFDRLTFEGKAKGGQPLAHDGKIVSGKNGLAVADGPFIESKEAIAGYILLEVSDLKDALEAAKECPGLEYGVSIEVRPTVPRNDHCGVR
jgi:hypothetical protein